MASSLLRKTLPFLCQSLARLPRRCIPGFHLAPAMQQLRWATMRVPCCWKGHPRDYHWVAFFWGSEETDGEETEDEEKNWDATPEMVDDPMDIDPPDPVQVWREEGLLKKDVEEEPGLKKDAKEETGLKLKMDGGQPSSSSKEEDGGSSSCKVVSATARTVGHLSKSVEVMKLVNNLMKAPQVAATMQEFSKEMTKADVIEEMVNDAVDSALYSEDIEEETEEEVEKVQAAIAGETASQLPDAVRKERIKQPSTSERIATKSEAIAEGVEDDGDLDEIRARLARVRS